MKRACVINCSAPHYNLGAAKLSNWLRSQGYEVAEQSLGEADLVCLSVIFTWDAPKAAQIAQHYKGRAEVWAGGCGLFRLQPWWFAQTGLSCVTGLDERFDSQPGDYRMVFASRGCPVGCFFCIVPQMEGKNFTLHWDFKPAPILADNNLSALPVEFQEHIIRRYQETGTVLLDANSGFEPHTFDEQTYNRWRPIMHGVWRYAFDIMPEWRDVQRVCNILKDESARKKRVYVLIGNEPMESCYERAVRTIEWGAEPHVQPMMKLDTLTKQPVVQHDWTEHRLVHFARCFNRFGWKHFRSLADYRCRDLAPFKGLKFAEAAMQ